MAIELQSVFNSVVQIVTTIASLITGLSVVFIAGLTLTKKGKKTLLKWLTSWFMNISKPTNDAILCVLRSSVRAMCKSCLHKKYMTDDEHEFIVEASCAYEKLGGNSYTSSLVRRALELDVREEE